MYHNNLGPVYLGNIELVLDDNLPEIYRNHAEERKRQTYLVSRMAQ